MKTTIVSISILIFVLSCQKTRSKQSVSRIGYAPRELVFSIKTETPLDSRERLTKALSPWMQMIDKAVAVSSRFEDGRHITMIDATLRRGITIQTAQNILNSDKNIIFASPNYLYEGQPFDEAHFEGKSVERPKSEDQYHHKVMQNEEAWNYAQGEGITIAVTDMGVESTHVDLVENLWKNSGEMGQNEDGESLQSNGIDDDGNGFVDDFQGWDTTSPEGDNDPTSRHYHGTHITGIIAASLNDIGTTGTAPKAKVIPIRFAGSGTWSSLNVARAYSYAIKNGAKIINTSFRIDHYIDDQIYLNAVKDAYSAGALIFNSAGNSNKLNPDRQEIDHVILVANTTTGSLGTDTKNPRSNYGWGIDISAPGSDILSTFPGNKYAYMSGTSMATPNAAAVAALIWSKHPSWNKAQVLATLYANSDNIDELNPSYEGLMGYGRVNSLKSLTNTIERPTVKGIDFDVLDHTSTTIMVRLSSILDPDTVKISAIKLLKIQNGLETPIAIKLRKPYALGSNRLILDLIHKSAENTGFGHGEFRLILSSGILDPFGRSLSSQQDQEEAVGFEQNFHL